MHPVMRTLGKLLRLVGISSPEDLVPKATVAGDAPAWRKAEERTKKSKEDASGG